MKSKNAHTIRTAQYKETWQCYLLLCTEIIGFFVFTLYPQIWSFKWAWFRYNRVASYTRFVGWDNFVNLFKDVSYWKSWITTLRFAITKMPLELSLALVLAVLLTNKTLRGKTFYRSVYFMPCVISAALIGLIFGNMFDYFGFVNGALKNFGIVKENVNWFASKNTAMFVLVAGAIWNTFGTNVLYFIAALTGVTEDVYESAKLDGANPVQVFFKITLPMIAPVLQTIILLSLIGTLGTGDYIITMTNGAPAGSTHTVYSYMISQFTPGFVSEGLPNIGYGCAASIVTAIIMASISLTYNKFSDKMKNIY